MSVPTNLFSLIALPFLYIGCTSNNQDTIETKAENLSDTANIEGSWQLTKISFAGLTSVDLPESGSVTYYTDDSLYTFHYPYYSNPSYAYRRNGDELIYQLEKGAEKKWRLKVSGDELQLIDKSTFGDNVHTYKRIEADENIIRNLMVFEVDWSHFNSVWHLDTTACNFLYQSTEIGSKLPVPDILDLRLSNAINFQTSKRSLTYTNSEGTYGLWFLAYRPDKLNLRIAEDTLNTLSDTIVFVRN